MKNIVFNKNGNEVKMQLSAEKLFSENGIASNKLDTVLPLTLTNVKTYPNVVATINGTSITVPTKEGRNAFYFDTLSDLKENGGNILTPGDVAITKGFYKINDGGGSTYLINEKLQPTSDTYKWTLVLNESNNKYYWYRDTILQQYSAFTYNNGVYSWTYNSVTNNYTFEKGDDGYWYENGVKTNRRWDEALNAFYRSNYTDFDGVITLNLGTNLCGEIYIPNNAKINIRQLGGKSLEDGEKYDNKECITYFNNFLKRYVKENTLFIPSGHWCFSETSFWHPFHTCKITVEGTGKSTVIMPYETESQKWIFRMQGLSDVETEGDGVYDKNSICYGSGDRVCNLSFTASSRLLSPKLKTIYNNNNGVYLIRGALYIELCPYSSYDNLWFKDIFCTTISMNTAYESWFGNLSFERCGGVYNGEVKPVIEMLMYSSLGSALSADWFRLMTFKDCFGNMIECVKNDFVHSEINTILIDCDSEAYENANDLQKNDEGAVAPGYGVSDSDVKTGVFSKNAGFSSSFPVVVETVQVNKFDSWAVRTYNDVTTSYRMNCISLANGVDKQNKRMIFGNICLPNLNEDNGPWVVYNETTIGSDNKINQIFDKNARPFYYNPATNNNGYIDFSTFSRFKVVNMQTNLLWAVELCSSYWSKYVKSTNTDSPLGLLARSAPTHYVTSFVAQKGKKYGVCYNGNVNSGTTVSAFSGSSATTIVATFNLKPNESTKASERKTYRIMSEPMSITTKVSMNPSNDIEYIWEL